MSEPKIVCPHHPGSAFRCPKCLEEERDDYDGGDEMMLQMMGPREPKIVAECFTCAAPKDPADWPRRLTQSEADKHRAAGHDVRPVEVKREG